MKLGCAVCVLATIPLAVRAQSTVPGWYQEELEVVATAGNPRAARAIVRTLRAGDYMRVERVDEQLPHMAAFEYVLTNWSAHDRYTVNLVRQVITRNIMTPAEFSAAFPDTSQQPRTFEHKVEAIGDGGRILGYRTTKVRERRVARTRYGPAGQVHVAIDTVVRVMWIATFTANPALAVDVLIPTRAPRPGELPRGVVMRSEETRVIPRRRVTHLEVRLLERRRLDPALFVLPADYRRVDPPRLEKP